MKRLVLLIIICVALFSVVAHAVEMTITKTEIDLEDGKFKIEGYLDIMDPDFAYVLVNPEFRLVLELETDETEDNPEFGIVCEDQVQLMTDDDDDDDDGLEFKLEDDDDDDDDELEFKLEDDDDDDDDELEFKLEDDDDEAEEDDESDDDNELDKEG